MKIRLTGTAFLLLIIPALAGAQLKQDRKVDMATTLARPGGVQGIVGLIGLDPAKFSMSHSYSLSFGSFGGQSASRGLYLNTMQYQFSDPLSMYLQIGIQHQPFNRQESNGLNDNGMFISGAGFEYKPTENFRLQFEFSQHRGAYYSRYDRSGYRSTFFDRKEEEN